MEPPAISPDWKPFFELFQFGVLGVFCVFLIWLLRTLWKDFSEKFEKRHLELTEAIDRNTLANLTLLLTIPHVIESVRNEAQSQKEEVLAAQSKRK